MTRNDHQRRSNGDSAENAGSTEQDPAEVTDGNPLGLRDMAPPPPLQPLRYFGLFAFVLLAMTMLGTVVVIGTAGEKKTALLSSEERRLTESARGRAKVLRTWLDGQMSASRRLTESPVFRLFVHDLALHDPSVPLPRSLQDQRPYFHQLVADFAKQNDLIRAAVLRHDGVLLLSSSGPALAVADLLRQLKDQRTDDGVVLTSARQMDGDATIVVDAVLSIPKAQSGHKPTDQPSALLVLTLPVSQILRDVLSSRSVHADHERIAVVQERNAVTEMIEIKDDRLALQAGPRPDDLQPGMSVAFGRRMDDTAVYSLGVPVAGTGWTLYHAIDARTALAPVHGFVRTAAILALMTALVLTAAFAAFWWRQGRDHHRRLADLYRSHAVGIERQRQFLTSITTSISDWLAVSDSDGRLIYANPAFKSVLGRAHGSAMGRRWEEVVQRRSEPTSRDGDLSMLMNPDDCEMVAVGGEHRIISERRSDLDQVDGSDGGMVRILRDHTDLATERRRRLKALTRTIDAFVHAIELRDPFLLGHTHRLRSCAIAVGRRLQLSDKQLSNLALAASLSQIGKIFVPDDILAKPERHNAEEESIMRDHIVHAIDILGRLGLEVPIVDALAQMHERLDGSGYPKGLTGEQIDLGARILGVADVFCARTAPRSYRDRQSAGKTLYHLASNEMRYDVDVVAALADIVDRGSTFDQPDLIETVFVDAAIWQKKRPSLEPTSEAIMP